jgi:hypothetical protein
MGKEIRHCLGLLAPRSKGNGYEDPLGFCSFVVDDMALRFGNSQH